MCSYTIPTSCQSGLVFSISLVLYDIKLIVPWSRDASLSHPTPLGEKIVNTFNCETIFQQDGRFNLTNNCTWYSKKIYLQSTSS